MELTSTYLPAVDSFLIKQSGNVFFSTKDAIIINRRVFTQLVVGMILEGHLDLESIEESVKEEIK